ncbi:dynamin family protein [Grosmannia clavigera kw1407]|uniref:Dynamin family protein n=1 Tax=Grosmannia clavigera (strain kw1407 / UAMH 11150) TaxID=655863 RepID=F0XIC7_GROCL|nr:dynamin family protein [Grosmannia clavigera kw1407]EFX02507.1 dynamin family protein [Grosmannia clavigera kw1407]
MGGLYYKGLSLPAVCLSPEAGSPALVPRTASVETRSALHTVRASSDQNILNGDDDDEPVLMEVRQIKSQAAENMLDRLQNTVAANVSFVSHGFTAIGDKVKELNDTLGELQALGIQHVTSLPELVLVGDQSAGKSSLMSSFSGIYLPRSEGACTRCPVHIRLSGSHGGSWSCRISLQQDYEYRPPANVTRASPFGPWFEQRRDIKEFATLGDPTRIEETLRWAQRATLNPSRDHSLYKPGIGEIWKRCQGLDLESIQNEAAFSPNTVALDILAPGLADLSFYDLPGVFTSAKQDEDQYLVKVVENLTAKYISHQQAIILWAVPMNADPETSSTFSIIRAQNAQSRTIGIMTKADLLPPGPSAPSQWTSMLRGEQHRIGHGYFMTARPVVTQNLIPDDMVPQRDPSRPADDLERQGAYEEAFFNKQLPGLANQEWRECFKEFEDRCGVSRLVAFMSQQLGAEFAKWWVYEQHRLRPAIFRLLPRRCTLYKLVSDCLPISLPQIKEKVTSKLLDVNRELAKLPDIPENPELEVRRSLADFASRIKTTLEGASLSPLWGDVVQQFRHEILDLKPRYIVKTEISPLNRLDTNGRIDLTHVDDSISSTLSPRLSHDTRRRRLDEYLEGPDPHGPSTPSKRQRGEGPVKAEIPSECSSTSKLRAKSRSLQEVRAVIASRSKPGMPGIVTEDVYNSLCMEAVRPWRGPLQQLLDRTYRLLDNTLHQLLCEAFSNLRERLVFKKAASILKKYIVDQFHSVKDVLLKNYALETRKFYTLDKDSLARHEHAEAKILARHRHYYRMVAYLGDKASDRSPPRPWELMAEEERAREDVRMNQEATKLGPDPFKAELSPPNPFAILWRKTKRQAIDETD